MVERPVPLPYSVSIIRPQTYDPVKPNVLESLGIMLTQERSRYDIIVAEFYHRCGMQ